MRRQIIVVAVEEACGRRDGNGEEGQESCGNSNKHPAGIAAPREEWEDFAGAVEDKGEEDDPRHTTRNQVGHPAPAGRVSYQRRRWEQGKLHSELKEKKEQRMERNSPSFDAATGRRTIRGSVLPADGYVSLALVKHSNEGGPGTQEIIGKEDSGPIRTTQQVLVYLLAFVPEAGDKNQLALSSGYQSKPGKAPSRLLQVHTPPHAKMSAGTRLGGNHTSASDSRSEAMDRAKEWVWRPFWAFLRACTRSGS